MMQYMNNRIQLTKAFNALKNLFNLKDIGVTFWSSGSGIYRYRSRPYLMVITNNDQYIELYVENPYYIDYAYVDEFNELKYIEASVSIQPWKIVKALFNIAQQSPVYLFKSNVDPYYCDKNQYILLNKGVQLNEFLIYADLNIHHGC